MDSRSQFLLQLLDKLGAPLMRAINTHAGSATDESGQKDAQVIAALMSETVKISISVAQAMNLKPEDGDADAIRVSLAALAGNLVADSYQQTGRLPGEADARRLSSSLESVLAFSDNFAPAAEHAQRLQTLNETPVFLDPMQANLYAMNALVPAIGAIAEFPFGQQETKLIQDVSAKLSERAKALREKLTEITGTAETKIAEMILLQSLSQIYASAHRAETARLKTLPEDARGGELSLEPVWSVFDRQLAMLEVLLGPAAGNASSGKGGGKKPAVETPAAEAATETPAAPAATEAAPPAATPPAKPGNPMSFFKKS